MFFCNCDIIWNIVFICSCKEADWLALVGLTFEFVGLRVGGGVRVGAGRCVVEEEDEDEEDEEDEEEEDEVEEAV